MVAVVCQNDDIFSQIPLVFQEVSLDISNVVDASRKLSVLSMVVDAHQEGSTSSVDVSKLWLLVDERKGRLSQIERSRTGQLRNLGHARVGESLS